MLIYSREGGREKRDVSCHLLKNRKASSDIYIDIYRYIYIHLNETLNVAMLHE